MLVGGLYLVLRGRRADTVLASGLTGRATIISLAQSRVGVGSASASDYRTTPIFNVSLNVKVPGHDPYQATVKEIVPAVRLLQLRPGAEVAIRADPRKLSRVVIDWSGPGA
jgi:hypothetical protein